MVKYIIGIGLFLAFFIACFNSENPKLPYLGEHNVSGQDTIYHQIDNFSFQDQDSSFVTNKLFKDKIYVANFFFTSCPTICPKTMRQMKRLYDKYLKDSSILLVSFSIDHYHDSIPTLKRYANKLEINGRKWHLLSGKKGETQKIARDYLSLALENDQAPGGFEHNGNLILIDGQGHVRSFCDGTDPTSVDRFILDIETLRGEKI